ncbi:MAG: prepilin-type N-terminal cleavage/methylation domain-containing protein [Gallionellaceae bacterium]|nr:prepilin-type N-terminal cleavage/methylation domain-containing protein [Gallionellaceae bacterium]
MCIRHNQRGISLIELIMFIIIVGIALAGVLLVMNRVTASSADPLVRKQALAIAESLLEEVELMPFTFCDPDDINAASAVVAAIAANGCATTVETLGPEAGEARYSATTPFDNVSDYHGFNSATDGGIKDITGTTITALNGYSASINVSAAALPNVAAGDALLIAVTVTGPDGLPVIVEGIRTRHAPRVLP